MAIGERIHFFRFLRGMTQKYLGTAVGFPERSADVCLAQYESGSRKPKADLTAALAKVLDVSPQALDVPDIDSQIGLMHTLFTLEDVYGLTVSEADGEVCLKVNKDKGKEAYELLQMLCFWKEQGYARKLIDFLVAKYSEQYSVLQVGTGDSPLTIPFYEKCGFIRSYVVKDFFIDYYDHPIFEYGKQLIDMVYLQKML